jgi:hypothetical protein
MASRRRVRITNKPAPRISAGVERGSNRRAPFDPIDLDRDAAYLAKRRGGSINQGRGWVQPNQETMPKSFSEDYLTEEADALSQARRGGYYDNPNLDTFPYPNAVRETLEGNRWSQSNNAQGDFIPLTYDPTKTSWPANGWDHRRTVAAGYSEDQGILRVKFFTDGAVYDYGTEHRIPPSVAKSFRLTQSPGRYINDVLENYGYLKVS